MIRLAHLLDHTTPVHLARQAQYPILHLIRKHFLLRLVAMLEELLDHIIAEDICHQLNGIGLDLPKDLILFVAVCRLELLLNEAGSVLITAELDNVIVNVLRKDQYVGGVADQTPDDSNLELIPLVGLAI